MTIRFIDAATYYQGKPHQNEAWWYLQKSVSKEIIKEFTRLYREENTQLTEGINLIKEFEGCKLQAYPDPKTGAAPITIGWGSTRRPDGTTFMLGQRITQHQADEYLDYDIRYRFIPELEKIPYWSEMNVNQRGSLLSFAYNLGAGFYNGVGFNTISRNLREKDWKAIPETLKMYRNPGTNVEAGLLRRRIAEGNLWSKK